MRAETEVDLCESWPRADEHVPFASLEIQPFSDLTAGTQIPK